MVFPDTMGSEELCTHDDWMQSARLMSLKPAAAALMLNLGKQIPMPMVLDTALLGLRVDQLGPALALDLAQLLQKVRASPACSTLLRLAGG
jgi:hypothetical protein